MRSDTCRYMWMVVIWSIMPGGKISFSPGSVLSKYLTEMKVWSYFYTFVEDLTVGARWRNELKSLSVRNNNPTFYHMLSWRNSIKCGSLYQMEICPKECHYTSVPLHTPQICINKYLFKNKPWFGICLNIYKGLCFRLKCQLILVVNTSPFMYIIWGNMCAHSNACSFWKLLCNWDFKSQRSIMTNSPSTVRLNFIWNIVPILSNGISDEFRAVKLAPKIQNRHLHACVGFFSQLM